MPLYTYHALKPGQGPITGTQTAASLAEARHILTSQGLYLTSLMETAILEKRTAKDSPLAWARPRTQVPLNDLVVATRQWAILLNAGFPVVEALHALTQQLEHDGLRAILTDVRDQLQRGTALATALGTHPSVFSILYRQLVAAGEASGTLSSVLSRLADYLESQAALRAQIIAALAYPTLMLGVSLLIIAALLGFVVPRITQVFVDMSQALPLPTQLLLAISDNLTRWGWVGVLILLALVMAGRRYVGTPAGRTRRDAWLTRLPLLGTLHLHGALGRFARTMGVLLTQGVPLLQALTISQPVLRHAILEQRIAETIERVREGASLSSTLAQRPPIPALVSTMLAMGEQTGELPGMFQRLADIYERQVAVQIQKWTGLLAPVMILVLGGIVLGIVLAILLPIFDLSVMGPG